MLFLLCFSMIYEAQSIILDPVCTTNGKFDNRAVNCANVYPDSACLALYGNPPVAGTTTDRNSTCYSTDGTNIDHELKSLSSEICARQCGYCCQSPAYNCANKRRPRVDCNTVTQRMCRNPTWIELLAEDCPNVCGFCERGCVDMIPDCSVDIMICNRRGLENFVRANCRRTCGLCDETTSTITSSIVGGLGNSYCSIFPPDNNPRCAFFQQNDFCNSIFFDAAFKRQHCATTCRIC